jgi:SHS family lactate transporter-like MFS transporter
LSLVADLKSLEPSQRSAIWASYLGWTLDAFDYFLLVFMLKAIAKDFHSDVAAVTQAIFLTLAARPIGAFCFGWLAERFGRRPVLMADIMLFSALEFGSAFAPSLLSLLALRFLFGIAMGGEWGLGASLVMESIPARLRGPVSGLLQSGYPSGYFIASLVYFLLFDAIGWRGMFMVGVAPALLVLLIRIHVKESPAFEASLKQPRANPIAELFRHWKIALYMIVLMAAFNAFSHGTQDLYPTFLQQQHHFDTHLTGTLTAIMNVGAIVGGIGFGIWSETIGRKRAIIIATALALPILPLLAQSTGPANPNVANGNSADIVVQGNRSSDRYRLPQQFRNEPSETTDRWRTAVKNDHSACHDVGPHGCGFQGNTVFTLRSDGSARAGYPGEGR